MTSAFLAACRCYRWIFVLALARFVAGWFTGLSMSQVVANSQLAEFPKGDRLLFEPGGLMLVEFLRIHQDDLLAAGKVGLVNATVGMCLLLYPFSLLFGALGARPKQGAIAAKARLRLLPLFLGARLAQGLGMLLLLLIASLGLSAVEAPGYLTLGWAMIGLLAALLLGSLAAWRDMTAANLLRGGTPLFASLVRAGRALRAALVRSLVGQALLGTLSLCCVGLGFLITGSLGGAQAPLALTTLVHVLVLTALCWSQATWLAYVLSLAQLTESSPTAPDETPARSDAPDDPS